MESTSEKLHRILGTSISILGILIVGSLMVLLLTIPIAIYKDSTHKPITYTLTACNTVSKCEVYGTFNQLTTCESMKKQLLLETKMNFYECEKAVK